MSRYMLKLKVFRFASFLVLLVFALAASAADRVVPRYEILPDDQREFRDQMDERDLPFCRAYIDNLNAFPLDTPPPVCEAMVHPKFPDFQKPQWRQWSKDELWKRREIVKQIHLYLEYGGEELIRVGRARSTQELVKHAKRPFNEAEWERLLKQRMVDRDLRVSEATVKLKQFGEVTFVRYQIDRCDPYSESGQFNGGGYFFALNKEKNQLNLKNYEKERGLYSISSRRTDLFIHQGMPIDHKWYWGPDYKFGTIHLAGTTCYIRYNQSLESIRQRMIK